MPSFLMIEERSYPRFFGKTIVSKHLKNISYFHVFFWERLSFIFRLKNKIIFLGKRNFIFHDDTRKIKFQCYFFGKIVFGKRIYGFSCSDRCMSYFNRCMSWKKEVKIRKLCRKVFLTTLSTNIFFEIRNTRFFYKQLHFWGQR